MNEQEQRVKGICQKLNRHYEAERKNSNFLIGCPFSLTLNGTITAEKSHRLAVGVKSDIKAEFKVYDFIDKVTETLGIDLNNISEVNISLTPGDVAQVTISTYDGDNVCCPLSSVNISFNDIMASDFTILKIK